MDLLSRALSEYCENSLTPLLKVEDYHQQFSRAGHGHITSMTEHLYSVEGTKGLSINYANNTTYFSSSKRKLTKLTGVGGYLAHSLTT